MNNSGESSRFTKRTEAPCFDCEEGRVRPVVQARAFTIDGHPVTVPGLVALVCDTCGERSWPESELARGKDLAEIQYAADPAA